MSKSMSRRSFLGLVGGSAAVLGLGLVGCGGSGSSSSSASTGDAGKTYVVATDTTFAPFEFTDDSNNFVGIDVDILAGAMEVAGLKYDLQSLGFDAAVAAMESGQADAVIAGMSITDARKEKYDFSDPYFDSYVAAAAKDGGDVSGLDGLKGKTVACKTGTQSADWAESIKDQYGFTITYFDSSDMMYQELRRLLRGLPGHGLRRLKGQRPQDDCHREGQVLQPVWLRRHEGQELRAARGLQQGPQAAQGLGQV